MIPGSTEAPTFWNDDQLTALLQAHRVQINASSTMQGASVVDSLLFGFGPTLLFLGACLISVAVNLSRVQPGPVLVFLYGFLAPVGVYAAVYRLWPPGHAASLSRLLVRLGIGARSSGQVEDDPGDHDEPGEPDPVEPDRVQTRRHQRERVGDVMPKLHRQLVAQVTQRVDLVLTVRP